MNNNYVFVNLQQIYEKYKTPKNLQEHMLRAAKLSELIINNWTGPKINKENIIIALLLHDLGNIVKMDLESKIGLGMLDPKDLERLDELKKNKNEFIKEYGDDDHIVTNKMLNELNVNERIRKIVKKHVFNNNEDTLKSKDYDVKIAAYCDQRIGPYGILTLDERFKDLKERYTKRENKNVNNPKLDLFIDCAYELEKEVLQHTKLNQEDINKIKINYKFG